MERKLNWIREKKPLGLLPYSAHMDFLKNFHLAPAITKVDLRNTIAPPIVDQGHEGSCTFNAWAYLLGAIQMKNEMMKHGSQLIFDPSKYVPFSRQFGYYGERVLMGTVNEDSGATLSVGLQATQRWGCCSEMTWPYSSPMTVRPSVKAYEEASHHKPAVGYHLDNTIIGQLKACLISGYPFVFGIAVYESFMRTGANGIVAMPDHSTDSYMGGHALACMGFDDHLNGGSFIVPNSWGPDWADHGYCYIPYKFLSNTQLAADFITARG